LGRSLELVAEHQAELIEKWNGFFNKIQHNPTTDENPEI
jgi:hypothetical protein